MGLLSKLQRTNNQTSPSSTTCKHGYNWWASFEYYPESVGINKSSFRGYMYRGENYWSQTECVVKICNSENTTEDRFLTQIDGCREVNRLAEKFNADNNGPAIVIAIPCLAKMEMVSFYNAVFRFLKGYERAILETDSVLLEERLEGQFQTFIDRNGTESEDCPGLLSAFSHFTYHESKGQLVVCNLQGVFNGDGKIILSSPVIHSIKKQYGGDDNGAEGMKDFFAKHVCNDMCKNWITYNGKIPSAPVISYTDSTAAGGLLRFNGKQVAADIHMPPPPPYDYTGYENADRKLVFNHPDVHRSQITSK